MGIMARPLGTAREPDWGEGRGVSGVVLVIGERGVGLTGGQKSSWTSTTIRAGLKSVAMVLVGD